MPDGRRAILSVSDKHGIVDLAKGLVALGYEFIATDGTAKTLRADGVPVRSVSEYTGQPEVLGGRVKTLHPKIFAAILAVEGSEPELARYGIEPVDLVVANLYPFEETIAKPNVSHAEAVENIDIGGVSLIRAAAKNADRVTVVVRPSRYAEVLGALRGGGVPKPMRESLALEAFEYTSGYDAAIYNYLARRAGPGFPPAMRLALPKAADPISAYGGVVGLNRDVDLATAKAMRRHVLDAVIAPGYDPEALSILKEKKKGAFLIMRTRGELRGDHGADMTRVLGGVLVQTTDFPEVRPESWKVVTKRKPTPDQLRDLAFGVRVSRYVKSNSIVLARDERTVGVGAGQMSRVDACMLAVVKAGAAGRGSVAVSDAYFPFRDGLDELAKGGIAAVAQPGGSIRDSEVIAAADEHGIAMAFTGLRLFKH